MTRPLPETGLTRKTDVFPNATQTEPPPTVTLPFGPPETREVLSKTGFPARLYFGSTRTSAPEAPSATQIAFLPAATPVGVDPASVIVCERVRLPASIREIVLSSSFAAQTVRPPTSIAPGRTPTGICPTTLLVLGSITPTEFGATTRPGPGRVASTTLTAMA